MDEVLELVDVVAEAGLERAIVWLLRIVGLLAVLTGLGLWLLTDAGLLVLPLVLIVCGLVVLVVQGLLLSLAEVVG